MSARLDTVWEHIRKAREDTEPGRVIDVGSDHGLTAITSLSAGLATSVICTDINEGPAAICRDNLKEAGCSDRAAVVVTDGLDRVALEPYDIVVISGLGGLNTIDILDRAFKDNNRHTVDNIILVLQPQKSIEDLRRFLRDNDFTICDETAVKDAGFHYVVVTAAAGFDQSGLSDIEYAYLGPVLMDKFAGKDPDTVEYYSFLERTLDIRARSNEECGLALSCLKALMI
ncbi:MAG: SAM-dependent methyltransferase [Clostridiales bacterium]|nr:SAM-dependent methyltransferase [Clostridiales bacterium]